MRRTGSVANFRCRHLALIFSAPECETCVSCRCSLCKFCISFKASSPGISDMGITESSECKILQFLQILQPFVRDLCTERSSNRKLSIVFRTFIPAS